MAKTLFFHFFHGIISRIFLFFPQHELLFSLSLSRFTRQARHGEAHHLFREARCLFQVETCSATPTPNRSTAESIKDALADHDTLKGKDKDVEKTKVALQGLVNQFRGTPYVVTLQDKHSRLRVRQKQDDDGNCDMAHNGEFLRNGTTVTLTGKFNVTQDDGRPHSWVEVKYSDGRQQKIGYVSAEYLVAKSATTPVEQKPGADNPKTTPQPHENSSDVLAEILEMKIPANSTETWPVEIGGKEYQFTNTSQYPITVTIYPRDKMIGLFVHVGSHKSYGTSIRYTASSVPSDPRLVLLPFSDASDFFKDYEIISLRKGVVFQKKKQSPVDQAGPPAGILA